MISLNLQVRRAVAQDHRQISNLIYQESNTHRHLDWRPALEWIGVDNFWVLEENGFILATLACPEDPRDVAWIRLFSHHSHLSGPDAWSALWNIAHTQIFSTNPQARVAAIVMKQWFYSTLVHTGFRLRQNIVLLDLFGTQYNPPKHTDQTVRIRPMQDADMPMVEQIDREAFGAFWHNSMDALQRARFQSIYSSVAEDDRGLIGYQISTGNPIGAHLARLAVRIEAQGRGVGSALVHDLIQHTQVLPSGRLSVNTQDDNHASLALYKKLGFNRTGEFYPVYEYFMDHQA